MTQNQKTQQQEEIQAKMMEELRVLNEKLLKIVEELKLSEKAELLWKWADTFATIRGILGGYWANAIIEVGIRDNKLVVTEIDLGATKIGIPPENLVELTREKIRERIMERITTIIADFIQALEDVTRSVLYKMDEIEDLRRRVSEIKDCK